MASEENGRIDVSAPTLVGEAGAPRESESQLPPPPVYVSDTPLVASVFERRYRLLSTLGEGGMGEVSLYADAHIGRNVAVKTLKRRFGHDLSSVARFLREARIQGQLEHPAIVPVHDLAVTGEGSAYFTMKRVRGTTLESVLERARENRGLEAPFTLRKVLSGFVSVCLAVDFAHRRHVLHRDVKPANIMFGDYGEVYLLDWGIAKVEEEPDFPDSLATTGERPPVDVSGVETHAGTLLGTPGYMTPEQLRGEGVTPRSDVYALGACLFEILALRRLNAGGNEEIVVRTLDPTFTVLALRAPDLAIAPELVAICERALAFDPDARFQTVRQLSDAIDRYLEGDRDLERRRELALEHVGSARAALALPVRGGADFVRSRTDAMRGVGRALALDPDNREALDALVTILGDVPPEEPPEVVAAIREAASNTVRAAQPVAAIVALVWFAFLPVAYWMGLRDIRAIAWVLVPIGISAVLSGAPALRRRVASRSVQNFHIITTCAAYVALSRLFGPYILVPTAAAIYAIPLQTHPKPFSRRLAMLLCCAVVVVSILLEVSGLVPKTTFFGEGTIVIHTPGTLREGPTVAFFLLASVAMILAPCLFIARVREALSQAERRLHLQAWYLERLVPRTAEAKGAPQGYKLTT